VMWLIELYGKMFPDVTFLDLACVYWVLDALSRG